MTPPGGAVGNADAFHHIMAEAVARDAADVGILAAAARQPPGNFPEGDPLEGG